MQDCVRREISSGKWIDDHCTPAKEYTYYCEGADLLLSNWCLWRNVLHCRSEFTNYRSPNVVTQIISHSIDVIIARQRSCGKVMFSKVCACSRGYAWSQIHV